MSRPAIEIPFKINWKITKYEDPSTKVVYNSTTKYDFVIIYLQILIKTAKIDQRVKQQQKSNKRNNNGLPKRQHGPLARKQTRNDGKVWGK
jgi:hypothetical protein